MYLRETLITFDDYLRLYKASWLKLQQMTPSLESYEDRALYSTWDVSLQYVEQQNMISGHILRFWAYFDCRDL
jgi:hypothetical protein